MLINNFNVYPYIETNNLHSFQLFMARSSAGNLLKARGNAAGSQSTALCLHPAQLTRLGVSAQLDCQVYGGGRQTRLLPHTPPFPPNSGNQGGCKLALLNLLSRCVLGAAVGKPGQKKHQNQLASAFYCFNLSCSQTQGRLLPSECKYKLSSIVIQPSRNNGCVIYIRLKWYDEWPPVLLLISLSNYKLPLFFLFSFAHFDTTFYHSSIHVKNQESEETTSADTESYKHLFALRSHYF